MTFNFKKQLINSGGTVALTIPQWVVDQCGINFGDDVSVDVEKLEGEVRFTVTITAPTPAEKV